jgi:hypothetical protein
MLMKYKCKAPVEEAYFGRISSQVAADFSALQVATDETGFFN